MEPVQRSELALPVSGLLETVILRVCACTRAGCGPWSPAHTLQHSQPGEAGQPGQGGGGIEGEEGWRGEAVLEEADERLPSPGVSPHQVFSWHWWYVVMLVAVTLALIGFLVVYVVMSRHRQTCFGYVPHMHSGWVSGFSLEHHFVYGCIFRNTD